MGNKTDIEWCDTTKNITSGCDGCEIWDICYARKLQERRFSRIKVMAPHYAADFREVRLIPGRLAPAAKLRDLRCTIRPEKPWIPTKLPRLVFISDLSDALSRAVPFEYLKRELIDVVAKWPHVGIWLTKQPQRMAEFDAWLAAQGVAWPENLWALTSVTSQATLEKRMASLVKVRAKVRGLSIEPLLSRVSLRGHFNLLGSGEPAIHWVIVGGGSGPMEDVQPFEMTNARLLVNECQDHGVACFVKQLGAKPVCGGQPFRRLRDPKGGDWSEWPDWLHVREFPEVETCPQNTRKGAEVVHTNSTN